jgi:uncharacterized protein
MKSDFYQQIQAVGDAIPPVELWNPPLSGDMDCRIKRDGSWWIDGSELQNDRLTRLFSTVLKHEEDDYFLVTPVEKWRIQVEDLPFMVVELAVSHEGTTEQSIQARTNVGDLVTIGAEHKIDTSPIAGLADDQAIPFVHVRSKLRARFNRNTYLEIAKLLEPLPDTDQYLLISANTSFHLSL